MEDLPARLSLRRRLANILLLPLPSIPPQTKATLDGIASGLGTRGASNPHVE